jgi:hypothetical protein
VPPLLRNAGWTLKQYRAKLARQRRAGAPRQERRFGGEWFYQHKRGNKAEVKNYASRTRKTHHVRIVPPSKRSGKWRAFVGNRKKPKR